MRAKVRVLHGEFQQLGRHILAGVFQVADEVASKLVLPLRHEGERRSFLAGATGASDAMDVRVDVTGVVVVDHGLDVGDVEATSSNVRRHENPKLAGLEVAHDAIAVLLHHLAVEGAALTVHLAQLLHDVIDATDSRDKDDHLPLDQQRRDFLLQLNIR